MMRSLYLCVYTPLRALAYGWVLSVLWRWFIVPTFHAEPLRVAQAVGLALVVDFLTLQTPRERKRSDAEFAQEWRWAASYFAVACLLALGGGYVVHRWWL
jgi:hypothetical protein